jgi:division protein CdvB (Snf7/Vps24/ESCRT-III family)
MVLLEICDFDKSQVIILQEKLEEKEKEIERVKKGLEIVSELVGDKKDEVDEIDEDAKEEIAGGE